MTGAKEQYELSQRKIELIFSEHDSRGLGILPAVSSWMDEESIYYHA